jgi:hypothetical protein
MNISSLIGGIAYAPTTSIDALSSSNTTPSVVAPPPAPTQSAATASISTPASFLSQMQQLSQTNPTEFKAVAAQVATSFQNAAGQATGAQAQFLTALANTFNQAAQTGSLQPAQSAQSAQASQTVQGAQGVQGAGKVGGSSGAHHHHHHHGGGGSSAQSSQVQQAFANAVDILNQATQGTSTSTSSSPT